MIKKLLFATDSFSNRPLSVFMLILRLVVGASMLTHGVTKLLAFETLSHTFADPLGVGTTWSLLMALGAEVGCSLLIIFGFFTRLGTLPLMFTMGMAFFVIHGKDPFAAKELALLYFMIYATILMFGAGRYSLDRFISK